MDVVSLGHADLIHGIAVHELGQIGVDLGKQRYADAEVAGPEQSLAAVLAEVLHLLAVVCHPSGTAAYYLDSVLKAFENVAIGLCGSGKLYCHISALELGAVKVLGVINIYLAYYVVTA